MAVQLALAGVGGDCVSEVIFFSSFGAGCLSHRDGRTAGKARAGRWANSRALVGRARDEAEEVKRRRVGELAVQMQKNQRLSGDSAVNEVRWWVRSGKVGRTGN